MFYGYCKNKLETIDNWARTKNKDIEDIKSSCIEHEKKLNEQNDRLNIHANTIEENETEIKTINEKIEAIIECLRNDRKDINALINLYKSIKPETKRKK